MNIDFATCVPSKGIVWIKQFYPDLSREAEMAVSKLLDEDILRVRDPKYSVGLQFQTGHNFNDNRKENTNKIEAALRLIDSAYYTKEGK